MEFFEIKDSSVSRIDQTSNYHTKQLVFLPLNLDMATLKSYNRALFTIIHDIYIHYSALSCFYHRYLVAAAACVNFGVVNCTCE